MTSTQKVMYTRGIFMQLMDLLLFPNIPGDIFAQVSYTRAGLEAHVMYTWIVIVTCALSESRKICTCILHVARCLHVHPHVTWHIHLTRCNSHVTWHIYLTRCNSHVTWRIHLTRCNSHVTWNIHLTHCNSHITWHIHLTRFNSHITWHIHLTLCNSSSS